MSIQERVAGLKKSIEVVALLDVASNRIEGIFESAHDATEVRRHFKSQTYIKPFAVDTAESYLKRADDAMMASLSTKLSEQQWEFLEKYYEKKFKGTTNE